MAVRVSKAWDKGGKPNKYRAKRTTIDGMTFDSKAEGVRYLLLKTRERAGEISDLELQPAFPLHVAGTRVGTYIADFRYRDLRAASVVVEDVKSTPTRTPLYRLKKKMVEAEYGFTVQEVGAA